tara:strand:- start:14623 stop:15666 length:1044 start_codon:yes stop_codon:yes gene_type:complete
MHRKNILNLIVLVGIFIGVYFTYSFYRIFFKSNTAFKNSESSIFISNNSSFKEVVDSMNSLLVSVDDFELAASKKGYSGRVKGGKYIITKGLNNHEIINILRGKNTPIKVVFNNQERLENLAGRISKQILADSLILLNTFKDPGFLKINNFTEQNALSMYLANSYKVFWNISPENFRNRMLKEYNRFWNPKRLEQAKINNLSPLEVISLAAIVQKETIKIDERAKVAAVYHNRLKKRMRLEADPTVIYALKDKFQNFDTIIRRVLKEDLRIKSPYNTYKFKGVPPGPITMPDLSSIEAVLEPESHKYLYFVANPKNPGYHTFSKTYYQHIINSKVYYRWINNQKLYR